MGELITYRVLYKDAAGEGIFRDVQAADERFAVWQVAIETASQVAEFVDSFSLENRA